LQSAIGWPALNLLMVPLVVLVLVLALWLRGATRSAGPSRQPA
jgi:hypothetical protein